MRAWDSFFPSSLDYSVLPDSPLKQAIQALDPNQNGVLHRDEYLSLTADEQAAARRLFRLSVAEGAITRPRFQEADRSGQPIWNRTQASKETDLRRYSLSSTVLSHLNRVRPLLSDVLAPPPENDYDQALLGLIDGAQTAIFVEAFQLERGDLIEALIRAAERGVRVQVLAHRPSHRDSGDALSALERASEAGLPLQLILSDGAPPNRKFPFPQLRHVKRILADTPDGSLAAVSGGLNFTERAHTYPDVGFFIEGVAAHDLLRLFQDRWRTEGGPADACGALPTVGETAAVLRARPKEERLDTVEVGAAGRSAQPPGPKLDIDDLIEAMRQSDALVVSLTSALQHHALSDAQRRALSELTRAGLEASALPATIDGLSLLGLAQRSGARVSIVQDDEELSHPDVRPVLMPPERLDRILAEASQACANGDAAELSVAIAHETKRQLQRSVTEVTRDFRRAGGRLLRVGDAELEVSYRRLVLRELDRAIDRGERILAPDFVLSDGAIIQRLIAAHQHGSDVAVLLDDLTIAGNRVNRRAIAELTRAGVPVRIFDDAAAEKLSAMALAVAVRRGLLSEKEAATRLGEGSPWRSRLQELVGRASDRAPAIGSVLSRLSDALAQDTTAADAVMERMMLHSKVLLIGDDRVLGGSANLSKNGTMNNVEDGFLVESAGVHQTLKARYWDAVWDVATPSNTMSTRPDADRPLLPPVCPDTPVDQLIFLSFDIETTGFMAEHGEEMVSLSLSAFRKQPDGSWQTLVEENLFALPGEDLTDADFAISEAVVRIHGLDRDALKDVGAEPKEKVLGRLVALIEDMQTSHPDCALAWAGQNIYRYDLRFLDGHLAREEVREQIGARSADGPYIDLIHLSRRAWPEARTHNLDAIAQRLGLRDEHRTVHTADEDVRLTTEAIQSLIDAAIDTAPSDSVCFGDLVESSEHVRMDFLHIGDTPLPLRMISLDGDPPNFAHCSVVRPPEGRTVCRVPSTEPTDIEIEHEDGSTSQPWKGIEPTDRTRAVRLDQVRPVAVQGRDLIVEFDLFDPELPGPRRYRTARAAIALEHPDLRFRYAGRLYYEARAAEPTLSPPTGIQSGVREDARPPSTNAKPR